MLYTIFSGHDFSPNKRLRSVNPSHHKYSLYLTLKLPLGFPNSLDRLKHEGYKLQQSLLCEPKLFLMILDCIRTVTKCIPPQEFQGSILQTLNFWKNNGKSMQWSEGSKLSEGFYKPWVVDEMRMSKKYWPCVRTIEELFKKERNLGLNKSLFTLIGCHPILKVGCI